jgi:hypothetical protein
VAISTELNLLTAKKLGSLAKELSIFGWHTMRKEELITALASKSRTKIGRELIQQRLAKLNKIRNKLNKLNKTATSKSETVPEKKKVGEQKKTEEKKPVVSSSKSSPKLPAKTSPKTPPAKPVPSPPPNTKEVKKEIPRKQNTVVVAVEPRKEQGIASQYRKKLRRDISTHKEEDRTDRLVLLVRDPFWLHAYWEITARTVERAKVALGMFWHTSLPIIRLFRLESDGTTQPKRSFVRDILIHGGVSSWYLDVIDPPSAFQIEVGYISREKKFYSLVSSNTVATPQQQVIDELDNLDGNWRGVAEDLGRIYKLSGGDNNNQELKKIFEEQLHRPMSAPLLSRYRASQHQSLGSEKTRRNFLFNIDVDIIIHGKTDPSVQVTIRNEPIKVQSDGSFGIRFALPEKRHVFSMEAEGSDGVETQRAILTIERNTRILETLFQETADDD